MIKNNLKVSLRVFSRNKAYTFINVLGLSTGLAIALLILVYVRFELSYEGKNPLADRIVRISVDLYNGKSLIDQDAEMYSPAGPRIASGFSEVESFTRVAPFNDATIRIGEESFRESKMFAVDSSFFHLFNYSLLYGNPKNIFQRPNEMVLTESQALKYFNRVNVVGESLWVSSFDEGFRIIGVVANNPLNTHIQFNVLISYPTIQDQAEKQSWGNNETYTYLLLKDQVTFNSFVKTLDSFNDQIGRASCRERVYGLV